jgi:flagellar biosynthesis/type III secretory pathway protein FliH
MELEIVRIDNLTYEFNGKRYSRSALSAYILGLTEGKELHVYGEEDITEIRDEAEREAYQSGYDEARERFEGDEEGAREEGYESGYEHGYEAGENSSPTHVTCANCGRELCGEALERLADQVTAPISNDDIARTLFSLSDYNAECETGKGE